MSSPRCSGGPPWRRLHWLDRTRVAAKPSVLSQSGLSAGVDAGAGRSRFSDRCHLRGPGHRPRSWVSSSGESSWWCQCVREAGRGGEGGSAGDDSSLSGLNSSVWNPLIRTFGSKHRCEAFNEARSASETTKRRFARAAKQNKSVCFFCHKTSTQSQPADVTSGLQC